MLSQRLKTVASCVTKGYRVADIGTDHGYIPIYLAQNGIVPSAIAMDINKGPLARAEEHIRENGLEDRIETRLSDGLAKLKEEEVDSIIIAGMGGTLIVKILSEGLSIIRQVKEVILSPHSDLDVVRRFLQEEGFVITYETMLVEDGKYYTVMKTTQGHMEYDKSIYFKYGKFLLESRNPILQEFLVKELATYNKIATNLSKLSSETILERREQIGFIVSEIKEALTYYESR